MIYRMKLADSVDEMTFDLLEVPIEDKDIEGATDNTTIDGNIFTDYLWLKKQFVQKWSLMCKDDYTQLRGFYTRQWENAEAPTYTLFAGQNRSETLTASGSAFRIQNGTQYDAPLTLTELKGNATQNGTPTPTAPVAVNTTTGENVVKITGKNLSPFSQYSDIIWGENKIDYKDLLNTLSAGTYTFSAVFTITERQDTTDDSKYGIYFANSAGLNVLERPLWGAVGVGATATLTKTFTITEAQAGKFTNAYFYGCGGATGNAYSGKADITNIQLELGTATTYEPYQGQEYEVNLGKNLLNPADISQGTWINPSITNTCAFFMPIFTGETFTISNQDTTTYRFSCGLCATPHAGTNTQDSGWQTGTSYTITAQSNGYLYVQLRRNDSGTITPSTVPTNTYMAERGSSATTYAPYFTPIELAKIGNYQDRIYKNDGKWYIEKQVGKLKLESSQGWAKSGSMTGMTRFYIRDYLPVGTMPIERNSLIVLSNYFKGITQVQSDAKNTGISQLEDRGFMINVENGVFADATAFRTWLDANDVLAYYALATPTTTEITNQALIDQLNFIVNLYEGTNNIMLVGTGAQGEIGVEYTLTYEKEQTIIPETTVRLTLTDGGVINTCECRQNVQLTMRETVQ